MTKVHHLEFHDGITPINPGNIFGEIILPRGWTCWVYPDDDHEFEQWMDQHCPSAEYTHRFNSGDPMYTVSISDEQEILIFNLMFND